MLILIIPLLALVQVTFVNATFEIVGAVRLLTDVVPEVVHPFASFTTKL